ncbi:hypothetical protein CBNA_1632 [Coxiella burnetii str. Namibia]|nr:hypothetical protein CBNA_1632 [Coxiella burnetii str. Namibia]
MDDLSIMQLLEFAIQPWIGHFNFQYGFVLRV